MSCIYNLRVGSPSKKLAREMAQDCLAVRMRVLNRALTGIYDEALRSLGIKASQMNLLVAVGQGSGVRPADLVEPLQIDPSTLSRNLERLRRQGWIEITETGEGRSTELSLTAEGGELLKRASRPWRAAQRQASELLGEGGEELLRTATDSFLGTN